MRAIWIAGLSLAACVNDVGSSQDGQRPTFHAAGILDPDNPEFHGRLLESRGWDFGLCAGCHGDDFDGDVGPSCLGCHEEGPTACTTCHGSSPRSGAHERHVLGGALGKKLRCRECHLEPEHWSDPGHILEPDGDVDPPPAEIDFGHLARTGPEDHEPPTFDRETGRCSNVYCHGATLDAGGVVVAPRWASVGMEEASCGRGCHAIPPPNHEADQLRCADCHATGPEEHINGQIDLD